MYIIYRVTERGVRYLYNGYMWGTDKGAAKPFPSENDAYYYAVEKDFDDFAIEKID